MDKFTIYCTEEQTKKALELGAPIEDIPMFLYGENATPKYVHKNEWNRECFSYCPTAEQMIGWLDEKDITVKIVKGDKRWFFRPCSCKNTDFNRDGLCSRKEAILAAIDSALDFLSVKEKVVIIEKEANETNRTNLLSGLNEYEHFKVCFSFSDGRNTFPNIRSFGNFYIFGETQKNVIVCANELDYGSDTETTCGELADILSKHQAQNLILAFRCNEYGKIRMFTNIRCCDIGHSDKVYILTGEEVEENTKL